MDSRNQSQRMEGSSEVTFARAWAAFGLLGVTFAWFHGFGLPFFTAKWLLVYAMGGLAALYFAAFPERFLVPLKMPVWAVAAVLFYANFLISTARLVPQGHESFLADRLAVLLAALFSFSAFSLGKLKWEDLFPAALIGAFGVAIFGLSQFFSLGFGGVEMPYYQAASTLGHTNNAGQWLAVLMLLVAAVLFRCGPGKVRALSASALGVAALYLFFARSRSVWLGLGAAVGWLAWRRFGSRWPWKKMLAAAAVLYVAAAGVQIARGVPARDALTLQILEQKSSMVLWRWGVWRATARMIADHPTGVGTDQFEFRAQPYVRDEGLQNPEFLAFSPHNEWLRYPAEEGIAGAVILFVALAAWCWPYFRSRRQDPNFPAVCSTGILLLSESVFQFPFQNPAPAFFFALWLGYVGSEGIPRKQAPPRGIVLLLVCGFLLGVAWNGGRVAYSRLVENTGRYEWLVRACDWFPANWRACNIKGKIEYDRKDYASARATLQKMLDLAPLNYQALQNMGSVAFAEGNKLEGCFWWWKYKDLFRDRTPKEHMDRYQAACPEKWRAYFEYRRPEKYLGRQH